MTKTRIHKVIAQSGLMSRRKAEQAIVDGRVKVNGKTIHELGACIDPDHDTLTVDHIHVKPIPDQIVILLNKPRQVITSKTDPENRKTVMDLIPPEYKVNPVGRLDYHSEGLLILTNDGALANRLTHPSHGCMKTYLAKISGYPTQENIKKWIRGIRLEDGVGQFMKVTVLSQTKTQKSILQIDVQEGRNRFIRRMLEASGFSVFRLRRIRIGPFSLGKMPVGEHKILHPDEVRALMKSFNKNS